MASSATTHEHSPAENGRFMLLTEEELAALVSEKDSKRTKTIIKGAVTVFEQYCVTVRTTLVHVERNPSELCTLLRNFYGGVRRSNGELYAKASMISIRYGLQRHFQKISDVDIVNDNNFKTANEVFSAMLVKLKAEGKGAIRHKQPIMKEDMNKIMLSTAVDQSTPRGLQNKVFVDIMMHLCNRGRENLREMMKTDFHIQSDSTGLRYVSLSRDMLTKNHRGIDDNEESQQGRMYETPQSSLCPISSFETYLNRLNPSCDAFWQRPKKSFQSIGSGRVIGYDKIAVGKNTLGDKLKTISMEAECSQVYTNHCLRATTITTLDSEGFEARHIMGVSGHKSETSIRHYSRVDEEKKRQMSKSLSDKIQGKASASEAYPNLTIEPAPASPLSLMLSSSQEESIVRELANSPVFPVNSQRTINYNFEGCVVNINHY